MRQGDGTDLLGENDPRGASIGIIRVDPTDERKDVLTAILAQEELQRKQIAIVLHEQNKAFLHPVDFDGLKEMRRNGLKAEVVFVARSGSGPAEFARQRRFAVYSSLESFASALQDQAPENENRRGWFGLKRRSAPLASSNGNGSKAAPVTDVIDMRRPLPESRSEAVSPAEFTQAQAERQSEDEEADIPTLVTSTHGAEDVAGAVGALGAAALGAGLLDHDADLLAPPPPSKSAANDAVSTAPTPDSAEESPDAGEIGKTGKAGKASQSIRAVEPAIITYPAPKPRSQSSGKLPVVPPDLDEADPVAVKNGNTGKLRAAMTGAGIVGASAGAAAFASAQTPAAPSGTPPGAASTGTPGGVPPRRRSRRWLALLLVLLTLVLLASIAYATPGGQQIIMHIFPSNVSAKVTITPVGKPEADDVLITAVTGKITPGAQEVKARIIPVNLQNQTGSAGATGPLGGHRASGPLLFINTGASSVTISGGTLQGKSGVPIAFGGPLTINPGSITVTGTAVNEGVSGDIPAYDIFGSCCASNILVRNPGAFSGGVNPKPNSVITQNDINKAINNLLASAKSKAPGQLKGQVGPNEDVVANSLNCTTNAPPDHKAGDIAPRVTVTGTATCSEEVFDRDGAKALAEARLRMEVKNNPDLAGYVPVDNKVITGITKISPLPGTKDLQVTVHANGIWVYNFTAMVQHDLKHAIAGKPESDALKYLKNQPYIFDATIVISSGNVLPTCSSDECKEITLIINNIAGPSGTPTLIPSSPPPTTIPVTTPPVTPTPQNGQGGS